jgi:ABC-type branched-subunit amino acid transport system substrate-binding protein
MSPARTSAAAVVGLVIVAVLSSCTATAPTPTPVASASPSHPPAGPLTIGTVFPVTGADSYLGPAQADGVDAAVTDINAAGGVNGRPVVAIHEDSGDVSTTTIENSFADLRSKGVDVLIGPSSSVLAERLFPKTLAAHIPMITPSATSVRLTALGATGYLFRTAPSEAAQGTVLAATIGGGKAKVALVYLDDQSGEAIRSTLAAGLKAGGGRLVTAQPFQTTTTDFTGIVAALVKSAPDAVVFVSNFAQMAQNTTMITKLDAAGLGGAKLWLTSEDMADYSQALPAGALLNVNGILEGVSASPSFAAEVKAVDPSISDYHYAPESYDATVLAALAATVAGSDSGKAIATHLRGVSEGGIKCTDYAECLGVLKTTSNIDYDGLTGAIAFDADGNPHPAHYGVYRYDGQNRFALVGSAVGG